MSMGLITGDRAAMMRGAMVTKLLAQMLRHVAWGTAEAPLDVLLVDMPPGTGDVHISMVQQVPLNGVLIVTTPQEVALIDARKCVQLFERTQVPRLGVIENMSYFTDPSGMQHHVFGQGGGAALAAEAGMDYWGQVPLLPPLGVAMDAGRKPDALPEVYAIIATRLLAI
jgi:ATP-binding protein involved in chromosome partitioning